MVLKVVNLTKEEWILLLLKHSPLDRIHIMKASFLIWHRTGRNINNYFEFVPYLYGPCSFEIYSVLIALETEGYIVQPPHLLPQWINYYLTEKGKEKAEEAAKKISHETLELIATIVEEVANLSFWELLRKVYAEAPDFAVNSMFKSVIK